MKINKIKKDFPILKRKINGKRLIYLDSAATSLVPSKVINRIKYFYENQKSNVHRGVYTLSEESTLAYEEARKKVANFINASTEEIIFTKNATESLNILAYSLIQQLKKDDEVLISEIEHHSNLVNWQQLCKRNNIKLKFAKYNGDINLKDEINNKTKIVSMTHISNVLGKLNNTEEISKLIHKNNGYLIVDGSQSVPHKKIDIKKLNCDFLVFSAHKMLGPFGIGVLYGKKEILENMSPFLYGGDMIKEVTLEDTKFNDIPFKFEAGTPNVSGAIALGEAIDYLNSIGMESIEKHEKELTEYALIKLKELNNIKIYSNGIGIISFNLYDKKNNLIHPHDISTFLDHDGICVRGGHHCAQPLMKKLGTSGSVRASFYIYNDRKDVDALINSLKKTSKVFS